jgi:hypothetical protein
VVFPSIFTLTAIKQLRQSVGNRRNESAFFVSLIMPYISEGTEGFLAPMAMNAEHSAQSHIDTSTKFCPKRERREKRKNTVNSGHSVLPVTPKVSAHKTFRFDHRIMYRMVYRAPRNNENSVLGVY